MWLLAFVRALGAGVVLLSLLGFAGDGAARSTLMVPPGHEEEMRALFVGPPLAGVCTWAGAGADGYVLRPRYTCPSGELRLELAPAIDAPEGALRTAVFQVRVVSGTPPPGVLDDFLARLRSREAGWTWGLETVAVETPAPPTAAAVVAGHLGLPWRDPVPALLALLFAAAAWGAWAGRRPKDPARATQAHGSMSGGERILVAGAAVAAVAVGGHAILHPWIEESAAGGLFGGGGAAAWRPDGALRLLSSNLYYWVAARTGAPLGALVVADLLAATAAARGWSLLLRRLGFRPAAGHVAGCLWLVTGAVYSQIRWPEGFALLAGAAILNAGVLAADASLSDGLAPRARAARFVLAVSLGWIGVWVKASEVLLIAPSIVLFAWIRRGRASFVPSLLRALAVLSAQAAGIFLSYRPGGVRGDFGKVGFDRVVESAVRIAASSDPEIRFALASLAILAIASVPGPIVGLAGRLGSAVRGCVAARAGRVPAWVAAALLAALWVSPFLLNRLYVDTYYRVLAVAPLLALSARALGEAARRWRFAPVVALFAVALFARRAPLEFAQRSPLGHDFLAAMRDAALQVEEPSGVVIVARCDDPARQEAARGELAALSVTSIEGVRWATGWKRASIVFATGDGATGDGPRRPGDREAGYCPERPVVWVEPVGRDGGRTGE